MYQEILKELVRDGKKISQKDGLKGSLYVLLTLSDLKGMKENGIEKVKEKLPGVMGALEYDNETKKLEFVSPNRTLVDLFHTFEGMTLCRDMNKSWNKSYYYRTIFPIMEYRNKSSNSHIDKVIATVNTSGKLGHFNQIHEGIIETGKRTFVQPLKKFFSEEEVFNQFGVSYERYYSPKRIHLLYELDGLYFNLPFLLEIKELLEHIKELYEKTGIVIYVDFEDPEWSNDEIYAFEHSLFIMFYGFLKNDQLQVKEVNGKKNIYGYLPLLSFNNEKKKTYKNYGRNKEPNLLVTAEEMLAYYKTGLFDCNFYNNIFHLKPVKGIEVKKHLAFINAKKKETSLSEVIVRNELSEKLPEPHLPFEHTRNRRFHNADDLFKEVRDVLFNHPSGFYNDFYEQLLNAESIEQIKIEPRKVTNTLKDLLIRSHPQFKEFFEGNVAALEPLFPKIIFHILEERVTRTNMESDSEQAKRKQKIQKKDKAPVSQKSKRNDVKDLVNLCSYLRQITLPNEEVITLNKAREKLASIASGNEVELTKDEFFYAVGQLSYFYACKSKSRRRTWEMYEPLLMAKSLSKVMQELKRMKMNYLYDLYIKDTRHNNIYAAVIHFYNQTEDFKISLDDEIYLESGLVDKNVVYPEKKEKNETEAAENEKE